MDGHPARDLWSGRHLTWHINWLEMLVGFQAQKHFLPDLRDRHVLVRTDNTAVVSYINHQGGLRSRPLYRLAYQILGWSQEKFLSLRLHLYAFHPDRSAPGSSGESVPERGQSTSGSTVLAGPSMVLGLDFSP